MSDSRRLLAAFIQGTVPGRVLMSTLARATAPRLAVGVVAAVFNASGEVLLVEHVFRTDYPWGIPGGWIKRGESPEHAIRRELREELALAVDSLDLVSVDVVRRVRRSTHPVHLGLGYCARTSQRDVQTGWELLSYEWVNPPRVNRELAPFQAGVVALGYDRFCQLAMGGPQPPGQPGASQLLQCR